MRKFLGLVNYYRDMWPKTVDILAPLAALTSPKCAFRWKEREDSNMTRPVQDCFSVCQWYDYDRPRHLLGNNSYSSGEGDNVMAHGKQCNFGRIGTGYT